MSLADRWKQAVFTLYSDRAGRSNDSLDLIKFFLLASAVFLYLFSLCRLPETVDGAVLPILENVSLLLRLLTFLPKQRFSEKKRAFLSARL